MGVVFRVKTVDGRLKGIIAAVPRLGAIIGDLASEQVVEKAKIFAPVRTGYLKSMITRDGEGDVWFAESGAPYALWQEFGTRFQPGKAHLRPALASVNWMSLLAQAFKRMGL